MIRIKKYGTFFFVCVCRVSERDAKRGEVTKKVFC